MVENNNEAYAYKGQQLDAFGTPMIVKTPIDFQARMDAQKRTNQAAMKKLCIVMFVSVFFITFQLVGGYLAGSIAIYTDSAHLASDMMGFGISIAALTLAQRGSTTHLTYGWHRAEIIGTLVSVSTIWIMTIWLLVEATQRFFEPPRVKGDLMLIVAVMGLIFNLIQMKILHSGEGHFHLGGELSGGCSGHDHGDKNHKHEHKGGCSGHNHSGHDHKNEHKHNHS